MGEPKKDQKPDAKPAASDLKSLVSAAVADAQTAQASNGGKVIAGPFEVGNIGHVSVVERELGQTGKKYTYAEFSGTGRPSRIPLAAAAVIAEQLG